MCYFFFKFQGAVGSLCVRPCILPQVDYSGTAHLLKLKPGMLTNLMAASLFTVMTMWCSFLKVQVCTHLYTFEDYFYNHPHFFQEAIILALFQYFEERLILHLAKNIFFSHF